MAVIVPLLGCCSTMIYQHELHQLGDDGARQAMAQAIGPGFMKTFAVLVVVAAIVTWWLVLTHKSRQVAQEEANRQTLALNEQALALMHEIESHQRTDKALQRAVQAAELANQAKTRYISAISHELRTPLNSIIGYAQLLDEDEGVPPHRRQAVSVIRRGGDHLLSLIEGTLDIARIESGKLTLDTGPMHFRECVQQIVRMFELQAAGKGIGFRAEYGEIPEVVRTDEKRMRQILINVLGNAVKFTHEGHVVFRLSYAREMALFEIEDTGPGISADEIEQVFEPFARGSGGQQRGQRRHGPGPHDQQDAHRPDGRRDDGAQHARIARHAGRPGGGIAVPHPPLPARGARRGGRARAAAGAAHRLRGRAPLRAGGRQRRGRPRAAGNVLTPLGFDVRRAALGHECLALLRECRPDAILMDLAMPGIDGWETIRRMRAQGSAAAPVAIVSANAFDKGLDNDAGIAPADFVLKPVRKAELLDWLGRALALEWLHAPLPRVAAPAPGAVEPFVVPAERAARARRDDRARLLPRHRQGARQHRGRDPGMRKLRRPVARPGAPVPARRDERSVAKGPRCTSRLRTCRRRPR
jgi:signal transduction histidine kinase/CheY-like chemotaxis protein